MLRYHNLLFMWDSRLILTTALKSHYSYFKGILHDLLYRFEVFDILIDFTAKTIFEYVSLCIMKYEHKIFAHNVIRLQND